MDSAKDCYVWTSKEYGIEVPVRVVNRVYTCKLSMPLNLNWIVSELIHLGPQLNPKRFAAVIFRLRDPKIATLIFSQGKIVCTGSKNKQQARFMIYSTVENLRKIGYKGIHIVNNEDGSGGLIIQNVVASVALPWGVDLKKLFAANSSWCTYDTEQFPGAIIRYSKLGSMTVLVFHSGKMVITGAKSIEGVLDAMDVIVPLFHPFTFAKEGQVVPIMEHVKLEKKRKFNQMSMVMNMQDGTELVEVAYGTEIVKNESKQEVDPEDNPEEKKEESEPKKRRLDMPRLGMLGTFHRDVLKKNEEQSI